MTTAAPELKNLAVFKLDNASAALTDYSDEILACGVQLTGGTGPFRTLGSAWQKMAASGTGPLAATISLSGYIDSTDNSLHEVLYTWITAGGLKSFEGYTPDTTAGSLKVNGECGLPSGTSLDMIMGDSSSGDPQTFNITLQSAGPVTIAAVAGS